MIQSEKSKLFEIEQYTFNINTRNEAFMNG